MAGIDYTIPGQFKGIQLESPMNAMAQAMQLRGLQEASQMNALKQQEYQQDVAEKNALAQIYANPNLKYGSPEFFAEVSRRAPRYFEKIATGEQQRQLALSTQQTREQQRQEVEQKQRLAKREFGLRKIAGAPDYAQTVSLIERGVRTGEIDREEGDDMLSRLNPDTDIRQFRSDVLTNLLPADKALTAASDIEKANLGVRKEKTEVEVKELDRALTGFNKTFNPAFISTTDKNVGRAQVTQRLTAMYDHDKLGAEAAKFMPLEQALKQHLAAYDADPENYVATVMNLSGDKIIDMRNKKADEEYAAYQTAEIFAGRVPLSQTKYFAREQGPQTASAVTPADATAPTPVPADATAPPAKVGEPVVLNAKRDGIDYLHPEAKRLLALAATAKTPAQRQALEAAASKIQTAFEKYVEVQRKRTDLPQDAQDVANMRAKVRDLRKQAPTPENLQEINDLLKIIDETIKGKAPRILQKVEVSTEKKYGEKFAGNIADADVALRDAAERAPDTAANANRILSLLQSGQVITGSAANVKLQMAKFLNLGGGNDSEAVTNTEVLISSLADSTLGAIKSSGLGSGQGFTDKDREFLERAKSGQITYEAASLKRLAELAHKAASATADKWNTRVKTIPRSAIEGTGISTDAISVPALLKSNTRSQLPAKNADGWELKEDANGRRAYVSPDGKQYKEVK